ncbi:MAG: hypothetical protein EBR30_30415, partial [Cytophagia bacterium]|nr:hypothetical protein [Cytophagia bacterium]
MIKELLFTLIRILPFATIILITYLVSRRNQRFRQDLVVQKPIALNHYLLWTISFLFFIAIVELSMYHFGLLELDGWHHTLYPTLLRILGIVILAPIAEELMF